ncbi:hypothetical protein A3K73_07930 [Candidatus Pacearchaeota archaeon RBG_13_36_9]|nr:MAG: hypothetical protein A3K73_07930 [Candidatus Pacearchaeota archaeon RBG_13_36_9]
MDRKEVKLENCTYTIGLIIAVMLTVLVLQCVKAANPTGPDSIDIIRNVTKNSTTTKMLNVSGGRIVTLDVNATVQNVRWKAFVGNVSGKFTLTDPEGATVFDWSIASMTGRIYATANATALSWVTINCSNVTSLEWENTKMNHTRSDDNITKTFNATINSTEDNLTISGGHAELYVGNRYMPADTCPTLNTYENSLAQDTDFEEVALYDGGNMIYAAILEEDHAGYNNYKYDFQMIVPEIGLSDFSGATAYYIYVEIGT